MGLMKDDPKVKKKNTLSDCRRPVKVGTDDFDEVIDNLALIFYAQS